MGRKGGKKHLKRKPAPKFWPIHRKEAVWTVKPKPGSHSLLSCIPLTLLIRDIFGFAKTRKEAKTIVSQGKIRVDGIVQREELFPIGLMDVVSIPDVEKVYRILPSRPGICSPANVTLWGNRRRMTSPRDGGYRKLPRLIQAIRSSGTVCVSCWISRRYPDSHPS